MARNRKRSRDRNELASEGTRVGTPVGTAAGSGGANGSGGQTPSPLMHAAPDAELADAQLTRGRPALDEVPDPEELEEFEESEAAADSPRSGAGVATRRPAHVAEHDEPGLARRFVGFLRGSWLELHRVQWPDRRQVMQATGVVIGFVIVAGVFLGVADVVASKLINLLIG